MSRLKAPSNLHELVRATFSKAVSANELRYFPTQVTVLHVNSIPFQLRFSPSLANKPKGPPPDPSKPPFDPFAHPPASLFITDLGPSHFLVLNKFAVVPEHFILATKENKPQTHVLEESDLEAALACIEAYEQARQSSSNLDGAAASSREKGSQDDGLFAFFNGGPHSGASQAHRHLQLLPVSRMKEGLEDQSAWDVLAQRADALQKTPFVAFSEPINTKMSSVDLFAAYSRVYTKACQAAAQDAGSKAEAVPTTGEALISYNMAMTKDTLVICPRKQEGCPIKSSDGRETVGSLALNGTVLAGTALVKNEAEWEALKKSPDQLLAVLRSIGISRGETEDGQNKL
ncbi:hypothetical protein TGAM01_v201270 [Trichoderma gamsii]|uniref:Uncharacterized protein n=1 Tax=Trichoderma gamsii TaxID=398673 RepID=A0A2P5A028_9HYPO|nr:hypothetical protein TGAM01_v201270 [Trichoderma gamsii]PON29904.1 hypothetical protein TGAM01_v201270 [Trichoderma gamsii]